jgi:hypothetical protein
MIYLCFIYTSIHYIAFAQYEIKFRTVAMLLIFNVP